MVQGAITRGRAWRRELYRLSQLSCVGDRLVFVIVLGQRQHGKEIANGSAQAQQRAVDGEQRGPRCTLTWTL